MPCWSAISADCGTTTLSCGAPASTATLTNWPSIKAPSGFGMVARASTVSVARSTETSRKLTEPSCLYVEPLANRILADDQRQDAAVGTDDIAGRDIGLADFPRDWRGDVGVAKIDIGGVEIGLVGQDLALRLLIRGQRLIARDRGAGVFLEQFLSALQLDRGQRLCRLAALQRALGRLA